MSASIYSNQSRVAVVISLIISVLLVHFLLMPRLKIKANLKQFDFYTFILILTLSCLHSLTRVGDLPDEAYVWASKIDNLKQHGLFGVEMYDGTFQESSVSTLPFLLSLLLKSTFLLTTEQSFIIASLIQQLVFLIVVFVILSLIGLPRWLKNIQVSVFAFSNATAANVSLGFDTFGAASLLIGWVYIEFNRDSIPESRIRKIELFIATVAPLVRVELAFLSILIFLRNVYGLRLSNQSMKFILKRTAQNFWISFLIMSIWFGYKYISFGTIIPSMMKYKSPVFDRRYLELGLVYIRDAITLPGCIFLSVVVFSLIFQPRLLLGVPRSFAVRNLLVCYTIFTFLSVALTGGDYFGASLARYVLPLSCAWIIYFYLNWGGLLCCWVIKRTDNFDVLAVLKRQCEVESTKA